MNKFRGVPDAYIIKEIWGDRAVVLADGGSAFYDLETAIASAERTGLYNEHAIERFLAGISDVEFSYERELKPDAGHEFPFLPLLMTAKRRAADKIPIQDAFWLVLRPDGER